MFCKFINIKSTNKEVFLECTNKQNKCKCFLKQCEFFFKCLEEAATISNVKYTNSKITCLLWGRALNFGFFVSISLWLP